MIQYSKLKMLDLMIIDYGMARHLQTPTEVFDFKTDIASVLRMFCALYVGNGFDSVLDIQTTWKERLECVSGFKTYC